MPALIDSLDKLEKIGEELGVKAHTLLWGAPDHVAFAALEADDFGAVGRYLNSIAIAQDFTITPVQTVADLVQFGKAGDGARRKVLVSRENVVPPTEFESVLPA